jgi:hypothetical protein
MGIQIPAEQHELRASPGLGAERPAKASGVNAERIRLLLEVSAENLLATWSDSLALFPYSSRLRDSTIVNDYGHRGAVRYTINSLLGLSEAARSGNVDLSGADVGALASEFLRRNAGEVTLAADRGLLIHLQTALGAGARTLRPQVRELADVLRAGGSALSMQDVAWVLWGAAAAWRAGVAEAADVVHSAYRLITSELVEESTGLPRHCSRRYRRTVVSFGALTYFLRAMHEAATTLGDQDAERLFERGVRRAISLQGPHGEWPWMIDARTGTAFDFYPVFTVHQDSMAMLFLHPALDGGLPGVGRAINRSLDWVFGENGLDQRMFIEQPGFAYRSIERAEGAPRLRRYGRAVGHRVAPSPATTGARRIRLNDECRSYHLGWILYAWSNRPEALGAAGRRGEAA